MEVLDESPVSFDQAEVRFGGFWVRVGATLLDGLILSPVTAGLLFFNMFTWKNMPLLIFISIISLVYKPFCEFYYGATLGKMALNLQVVNLQFEKASIEQILLRNIFHIVPALIALYFSIDMFQDPDFQEVDGFMEYARFGQSSSTFHSAFNFIVGGIGLADAIVMAVDKQSRSLHDKIGGTFVIHQ